MQSEIFMTPEQCHHDQKCRKALRQRTRKRHSNYIKLTDDHKKQIQDHIHDPRQKQISQRTPRIPGRTEHRVSEIIKRKRRNPQEIDPDVQSGLVDQLLLRI